MSITLNEYSVPLIFGVWHGLLFASLLFIRGIKNSRLSDYLLASFLICGCLLILPYMLGFMRINIMWKELLFFPQDPGLIVGPIVYFYLVSQTDSSFRFKPQHLWHALPITIFFSYQFIVYVQGTAFVHTWMDEIDLPYLYPVRMLATLISNYVYLFLSWRYYRQYRTWVESEYADTEKLRFRWYQHYLYLLAIGITVTWIFNAIEVMDVNLDYTQSWWQFFVITGILYYVGMAGYMHPQPLYLGFRQIGEEKEAEDQPELDEEMTYWKERLETYIQTEKPYLRSELTLSELSTQIGGSKAILSQLINSVYEKNYNQFINEYRIHAFKSAVMLPANKSLTILGVAMNCGFNSKATFNRVFKQLNGISPSEYVKQQKLNHE